MEAVSYTHLDVYKRQDKSPARKKLFPRRAFVSNSQIFGSAGEGTGQNRLPQAPGAMEYQKKREKSRHAPFTRL